MPTDEEEEAAAGEEEDNDASKHKYKKRELGVEEKRSKGSWKQVGRRGRANKSQVMDHICSAQKKFSISKMFL